MLREFTPETAVLSNPRYTQIVDAVKADIDTYCRVTLDDQCRMVHDFGEHMNSGGCLAACASCGIRDPQKPANNICNIRALPTGHWLILDESGVAVLEAMPSVTLVDVDGIERHVDLRSVRSFWVSSDGQYYHLHPELVDICSDGECTVYLCAPCAAASKKPCGPAPPNSIAGGLDYGVLSRIGIEPLSSFEQLLLSDVRTYSITAKVHVPNGYAHARSLLRGHLISFCHDGPTALSEHFDACRIEQVLRELQVVFVGPSGRRGELEQRALRLRDLRSRDFVNAFRNTLHDFFA